MSYVKDLLNGLKEAKSIQELKQAGYQVLTAKDLVPHLLETLKIREGDIIDPRCAEDLARNIAASLIKTVVLT